MIETEIGGRDNILLEIESCDEVVKEEEKKDCEWKIR
jgi:hypothetical protein